MKKEPPVGGELLSGDLVLQELVKSLSEKYLFLPSSISVVKFLQPCDR